MFKKIAVAASALVLLAGATMTTAQAGHRNSEALLLGIGTAIAIGAIAAAAAEHDHDHGRRDYRGYNRAGHGYDYAPRHRHNQRIYRHEQRNGYYNAGYDNGYGRMDRALRKALKTCNRRWEQDTYAWNRCMKRRGF